MTQVVLINIIDIYKYIINSPDKQMEEIVNSPPEINKNCKLCGVVLRTGRKNFCSYAHKWEWQNNRWLINCNQCGVQFMLKKGQRSHYRKLPDAHHFCSKVCWCAWWKVNSRIIRDNKKNANRSI